jgi:hypothetical protein
VRKAKNRLALKTATDVPPADKDAGELQWRKKTSMTANGGKVHRRRHGDFAMNSWSFPHI